MNRAQRDILCRAGVKGRTAPILHPQTPSPPCPYISLALSLFLASPGFPTRSGTRGRTPASSQNTHRQSRHADQSPRSTAGRHRLHGTFLHPSQSHGHPVQTKAISSPATTFRSALQKADGRGSKEQSPELQVTPKPPHHHSCAHTAQAAASQPRAALL